MTKRPIRLFLIILCVGVFIFALRGCLTGGHHDHTATVKYQCPMHPQIVQDRPGKCPICHMDLQPMKEEPKTPTDDKKVLYYRHPMDPRITSPVPTKDDMGMPFIPVYEEGGASSVPGRAEVSINMHRQQLIGVKTARVERRELTKTIQTVGRIAYDPALYKAQEDYLAAVRSLEEARQSPVEGAETRARDLVTAIRTRLRILGLGEADIDALGDQASADRGLLIAEDSGAVWLYADIYEQDFSWIGPGQAVRASLPSDASATFDGRITSIDPTVDPATRTAKARARIDRTEGRLRPGMYVNAVITIDLGERLVVPRGAVLDTGKRKLVYVLREDQSFVPREVVTGIRGEDYVEVKSGLSDGENVVVSGNFLVDAESQLRGSAGGQAFYGGREAGESAPRREE